MRKEGRVNARPMNKISIITTTFNAAATLKHCFASLAEQTVPFEHIVVDGGSTDGTLEIIEEHKFPDSQFVSESDEGVYDALNKGIGMAAGEILGILHADDFYADTLVLARVAHVFEDPSVMACYGDLLYVSRDTEGVKPEKKDAGGETRQGLSMPPFKAMRYWKSGDYDPRKFYWGWMPPHPTFFVRKSVYEKYGRFSLDCGTAADYELMLRLLVKHQITCTYIPEVLTCMRTGGMSNSSFGNRLRANRMDSKAWRVNGLQPYFFTTWLKPVRKIPQFLLKPGTWDATT
jgi:glycosyltransferase